MFADIPIVVLCGGEGRRLRPRTEFVPKTLIPLNGKPMLQHILEYHLARGRREFIFCVGYLGHEILNFLKTFPRHDAVFAVSDLGTEASMLERICGAFALTDAPMALIVYGDTLIDTDLGDMVNAHRRLKVDLTLTTASIRIPFGLVSLDANQKVLSFEEKPVQTYFIGQMLWNRQVATQASSELLDLADGQGLVNLIQGLTMNGMVGAFQYAGPQITFNTEQELQKAEHDIISFYTQTI